ncbi:hypothetical protein [Streptomyces sp. NPDC093225]|uniref:hypothetical protein n=1 Tax=Streptomyces sp. NPDC093225 TaxID=3366034 RepID=UPI0038163096
MQRVRTTALVVAAALAAGAGIAYARQGEPASAASRTITTLAVWGHTDINPGQVGTARTDDCPAGQLVTGGGGFFSYHDAGAFTMSASSIAWNSGPKGWYVTGRNNGTEVGRLYTYGLCTDAVGALPLDAPELMPELMPKPGTGGPDAPGRG